MDMGLIIVIRRFSDLRQGEKAAVVITCIKRPRCTPSIAGVLARRGWKAESPKQVLEIAPYSQTPESSRYDVGIQHGFPFGYRTGSEICMGTQLFVRTAHEPAPYPELWAGI